MTTHRYHYARANDGCDAIAIETIVDIRAVLARRVLAEIESRHRVRIEIQMPDDTCLTISISPFYLLPLSLCHIVLIPSIREATRASARAKFVSRTNRERCNSPISVSLPFSGSSLFTSAPTSRRPIADIRDGAESRMFKSRISRFRRGDTVAAIESLRRYRFTDSMQLETTRRSTTRDHRDPFPASHSFALFPRLVSNSLLFFPFSLSLSLSRSKITNTEAAVSSLFRPSPGRILAVDGSGASFPSRKLGHSSRAIDPCAFRPTVEPQSAAELTGCTRCP